jgi:hypothetical protein
MSEFTKTEKRQLQQQKATDGFQSILLEKLPGDVGNEKLGAMLTRIGNKKRADFAWHFAKTLDMEAAAKAAWPDECEEDDRGNLHVTPGLLTRADRFLGFPEVTDFIEAYKYVGACPNETAGGKVCGKQREGERMAGKIFWHECAPCQRKAKYSAWVEWKERVREEWDRQAFEMIGKEHWPESYPMIDAVQRLLDPEHPSWAAYLYGKPGTGKTQQAAELIRVLLTERVSQYGPDAPDRFRGELRPFPPILFEKEARLIQSLKPYGEGLERFQHAPLLIIDDLGVAVPKPFAYEMMSSIIDHRYDNHLPTLFTSNLSLPELRAGGLYDERLTQRIFTMCGGVEAHRAGTLALAHMTRCYRMDGAEEGLW